LGIRGSIKGAREVRVGVYLGDIPPSAGGGYTLQQDLLEALLEHAEESRHSFFVLTGQEIGMGVDKWPRNVDVIPLRTSSRLRRFGNRIRRRLGEEDTWLLENGVLDGAAKGAQVEFLWSMSAGLIDSDVPFLVIVLDLAHRLCPWFPEVGHHATWLYRERAFSRALRRASYVVVGTQAGRADVERMYQVPSDRIRILPHPTPRFARSAAPAHAENVPAEIGIQPGFLLYPAQFWPHKNHANLLLAIKDLVSNRSCDVKAVFVGSDQGNLAHVQRFVSDMGLSSRVRILGFVERETLVSLYQHASALTYVSFFGPENLPALEAFALGCPVIASDVPGAAEQLGNAAILIDPRDPHQIADAIERILREPSLRNELIARGLKRASRWTAAEFVRAVFGILDEFESVRRCWSQG
jgi:glycosyltransferase involved in cell wall biosynthesis